MSIFPFSRSLAAVWLALASLSAANAHAQLGGTMLAQSASGTTTTTLLNGALRLRTLIDTGNTTINEYATSTGEIVAYTWQGPTMPDLPALLGNYAASYRAGVDAAPADGNLHSSRVAQPDVIVESGGLMRSYVGRAWLPNALPPGVSVNDLR